MIRSEKGKQFNIHTSSQLNSNWVVENKEYTSVNKKELLTSVQMIDLEQHSSLMEYINKETSRERKFIQKIFMHKFNFT